MNVSLMFVFSRNIGLFASLDVKSKLGRFVGLLLWIGKKLANSRPPRPQ